MNLSCRSIQRCAVANRKAIVTCSWCCSRSAVSESERCGVHFGRRRTVGRSRYCEACDSRGTGRPWRETEGANWVLTARLDCGKVWTQASGIEEKTSVLHKRKEHYCAVAWCPFLFKRRTAPASPVLAHPTYQAQATQRKTLASTQQPHLASSDTCIPQLVL